MGGAQARGDPPAGPWSHRPAVPRRSVFVEQDGKVISPWHDVPYKNADGTYNFFCEIPKETKAKMECATDEPSNPIKQDTKKGKLRDYPYNIHWNYGMIPQTWEDPQHANAELGGVKGDNDPVDVVEIGSQALASGGIYKARKWARALLPVSGAAWPCPEACGALASLIGTCALSSR